MSTATLQPRTKSPLLVFLLLIALLGLGWVHITKDGPIVDEINTAMDTGITIPTTLNGCNNFRLKDFKTPGKWRMQFRKRGFTVQRVSDILRTGAKQMVKDKNGKMMMRITCPKTGDYIVVDPLTCQIWQIAPSEFTLKHI